MTAGVAGPVELCAGQEVWEPRPRWPFTESIVPLMTVFFSEKSQHFFVAIDGPSVEMGENRRRNFNEC